MLYHERATRLRRLGIIASDARREYLDAVRERDAEIDEADRDGWGVRDIARAVGVKSPQTIERALARVEARRQEQEPPT